MTFLQYIIGNAITAIVVTAALIIFNPANREKRREAKLRREEDLILRLAKKIESERKPATPTIKPPKALNNQGADEIEKMSDAAICDIREGRFSVLWDDRQKWTVITESGYAVRNYDWLWDAPEEIEANGNKYKLAKKINLGHSWECEYHIVAKKTPPAPPTSGSIAIKPQVYPRSTSDELKAAIEAVDREQKENLAQKQKPVHECRKCKYFDDSGGKFGLCIKNEEIVDENQIMGCWTAKSMPVKAKAKPISRPAPLGTVTKR